MDYNNWIERAKECVKTLRVGTKFVVKDLFQGTEWNDLSTGEKLSFGKYFKNEVLIGKIPSVEYTGKLKNNSASYIKRREQ